ncbi:MAG: biotin-dependent carboxyltransferase family protein [Thermodesulfobacteriota bacterium]|nr:biotin-dependent carboxyltransferase family protein [Thermodesulfobacteriota bacterium]
MEKIETLEILSPGILSMVQDIGRFGFGRYGVASSGAVDKFSLRVGNILVGNHENEACLEVTLFGLKFRVITDTAIAFAGADFNPYINDDKPLKMWRTHLLKKGDTISFRGLKSGCRSYLAIQGGISVPAIMGSKSTNLTSSFGGLEGRPLKKGDIIYSGGKGVNTAYKERSFPIEWVPQYGKEWTLRVIFGPQDEQFSEESKDVFVESIYNVSPKADRTGIRLTGPVVERMPEAGESIISEGVISGAIQIPGDGQPIIILGETVTGGYRKIATVISADLPLLGQLKPGDTVRFKQVSLDEAYKALQGVEDKIKSFKDGLS